MDLVKELLKLYSEINMIYIKLCKLEIGNSKDDDLIILLKNDIEKERVIIKKILECNELSIEEIYKILEDVTDRPFKIRLEDYMMNNLENEGEYFKIYEACCKNIFLIYLSFIQEYVDNENYSYLREKLLIYKYYSSFINHEIENILIDLSFNVDSVNYINLDLIVDMLKIDNSREIIYDCCMDMIRMAVYELLNICDDEYDKNGNLVLSINNQCIIRASLVILNDNNLFLEDLFGEYIDLCNEDNNVSVDIINSIFNNRRKDMGRVKRISLKPIDY